MAIETDQQAIQPLGKEIYMIPNPTLDRLRQTLLRSQAMRKATADVFWDERDGFWFLDNNRKFTVYKEKPTAPGMHAGMYLEIEEPGTDQAYQQPPTNRLTLRRLPMGESDNNFAPFWLNCSGRVQVANTDSNFSTTDPTAVDPLSGSTAQQIADKMIYDLGIALYVMDNPPQPQ